MARSAHERSHQNADRIVNGRIKWPWEHIASNENIATTDYESNKQDMEKTPPRKLNKKKKGLLLQTYAYDEQKGYIYCMENPSLVFGVENTEAKVNPVVLQLKNENSIFQKWHFDKKNNIVLKTRPHLVLTVQLPPADWITRNAISDLQSDKEEYIFLRNIFSGAQITLQNAVTTETGSSNQKWNIDKDFGFIYGLQADDNNISMKLQIYHQLGNQVESFE